MAEETKRMLAALFGSGAVTFLALAILIPSMSGLGLMIGTLIGAAVGYFGVEWKQTVQGLRAASRATTTAIRTQSGPLARRFLVIIHGILRGKYPVFVVSMIVTTVILMSGMWLVLKCLEPGMITMENPDFDGIGIVVGWIIGTGAVVSAILCSMFWMILLPLMISDLPKQGRWNRRLGISSGLSTGDRSEAIIDTFGPFSEQMTWKLLFLGLGEVLASVVFRILKHIGGLFFGVVKGMMILFFDVLKLCLWTLPKAMGLFMKTLFIEIHSNLRLMVAVDGPLGGLLAYGALTQTLPSLSPAWQLTGALLGGILAIVFGEVNHELLTKRFLASAIARRRSRS